MMRSRHPVSVLKTSSTGSVFWVQTKVMDEVINKTKAINKRHVFETGFNEDRCVAAIVEHCDRQIGQSWLQKHGHIRTDLFARDVISFEIRLLYLNTQKKFILNGDHARNDVVGHHYVTLHLFVLRVLYASSKIFKVHFLFHPAGVNAGITCQSRSFLLA